MNTKKVLLMVGLIALSMTTSTAVGATPQAHPVSGGFPVSAVADLGGVPSFSTAGGTTIACANGAGSGQATSSTTAEGSYTAGGCSVAGFPCTSDGHTSGTIRIQTTTMHLVYLDENHTKPGVLVTPPATGVFAQFKCLGINVEVKGSGFLAELTSPKCGQTAKSSTAIAQQVVHGTQKYTQVEETGSTYDLTATMGEGAPETAAINGALTATAEREGTLTCPEQK